MKKNKSIEFWRFIFAVLVCFFHFNGAYFNSNSYFSGGYIAVEFFFILSGFLLMATYNKRITNPKGKNSAFKYTMHKILTLYPHYIFSFIIIFIFEMLRNKESLTAISINFINSIWEITMLQMSGIRCSIYNQPTWYISALVITGYIIYYLLTNYTKVFIQLIAPISVMFIYAYLSINIGHVNASMNDIVFIKVALLRAFAGMSLGCLCYVANIKLREYSFNKKFYNLLDLIGMLCFCFVIYCTTSKNYIAYSFISILLLAIAITISFLEKGFIKRLLSNNLSVNLGKISYAMFLNHVLILEIFGIILPGKGNIMFLVFIITTILYSIITYKFVNYLTSKLKNINIFDRTVIR